MAVCKLNVWILGLYRTKEKKLCLLPYFTQSVLFAPPGFSHRLSIVDEARKGIDEELGDQKLCANFDARRGDGSSLKKERKKT